MLVFFKFLAVLCCILFAGAAIYINLVEHPARMGWGHQGRCNGLGAQLQEGHGDAGSVGRPEFLAGVGAWLLGGGTLWLIGAVLIGLVVPYTFIVVMPTNQQLLAPGRDLSSAETRSLLEKWGRLHAVRSEVRH